MNTSRESKNFWKFHQTALKFNSSSISLLRTQDPNLWVQALSYFATKEKDCKPYIVDVLSQIDRHNLLPPLLVIQTLAHNSTATLTVIKVGKQLRSLGGYFWVSYAHRRLPDKLWRSGCFMWFFVGRLWRPGYRVWENLSENRQQSMWTVKIGMSKQKFWLLNIINRTISWLRKESVTIHLAHVLQKYAKVVRNCPPPASKINISLAISLKCVSCVFMKGLVVLNVYAFCLIIVERVCIQEKFYISAILY